MGALIGIANKVSSNLTNDLDNDKKGELISLLKHKIENSILEQRSIIIDVTAFMINCRNSIYVEDYEIDEESLYLNNKNFEVHIYFNNDTIIEYEEEPQECFTIKQNNREFNIFFI